ncbi:MAG: hypothetical protein LBR07_04415, partial [Puniceicoccales bacterium]|nr:hypothetical protein [Puniceicoccales bacterium]
MKSRSARSARSSATTAAGTSVTGAASVPHQPDDKIAKVTLSDRGVFVNFLKAALPEEVGEVLFL